MNRTYQMFGVLLALPIQAMGLILLAYYGGLYLDENHPISVSWLSSLLIVATICIFYLGYVIVAYLIRLDKRINED